MTLDELEKVVLLACENGDRFKEEQKALLSCALYLDVRRGAFTTANTTGGRQPKVPWVVGHVMRTIESDAVSGDEFAAHERRQYANLLKRWAPCEECGDPMGAHSPDHHVPDANGRTGR